MARMLSGVEDGGPSSLGHRMAVVVLVFVVILLLFVFLLFVLLLFALFYVYSYRRDAPLYLSSFI